MSYAFRDVSPGRYELSFSLINFGSFVRTMDIAAAPVTVNAVLQLALNAEVTVTGRRTFMNLADVENPAENLVGIAQSSSQGAITAQQLDVRPLMRTGEVLETIPGVITTQHSGEGKANQYFLRGFNLDHGTDLAQTIAGLPVNMPTHGHGQGYSDVAFMIPELVTGVQFSKGPYFADQGDFATAGAANINYATMLDRPIAHVDFGGQGFRRVLLAASPAVGTGHLLAAFEAAHDDGPWENPDNYRKFNGVVRYSRGNSRNAFAITGMAYHGEWNSTDQLRVARRHRGAGRPVRRHRSHRSRPQLSLQRLGGLAEGHEHHADQGHGVRHRLRPQPVFELHVLPGRSRSGRPVRAGRSPLHQRRRR